MLKRSVRSALKLGTIAIFAACLAAPVCTANTIQYQANIGFDYPMFQAIASVTAFNTNLGILNSITIQIAGGSQADIALSTSRNNVSVWGSVGAIEQVYVPGLGPNASGAGGVVVAMALPAYVLGADAASGIGLTSGTVWNPTPNPVSSSDTKSGNVPVQYFSLYQHNGPGGTVDMPFLASVLSTLQSNGSYAGTVNIQAGATVTVTYDYTTIPEPITLVLLGSGLLCMGVLGRRRFVR